MFLKMEGKSSDIERSIFVDGELPYGEMALLTFHRVWKYDIQQTTGENGLQSYQWEKDNQGNDCKPGMVEAPEWMTSYCYDSDGYITTPLSIYLTKGTHTITMLSLKEPMLIRRLTLENAAATKSYAEVKAEQDGSGAKATTGQKITIQGEDATKSSSQMLYPQQDQSSPAVSPSSHKELLNNTVGGNSWRLVGQWIEWDFDTPETGYYNISLYDCQNYVRGIYVSRRIMIDGEVPFAELEDYGFTYGQSWREDVLADEQGNPYSFYLEQGHHTIRMEVVLGDFSSIISEVEDCVQQLNNIYRKVIKVTGVSPDTYRDYQIEATLPELHSELVAVRDQLDAAITNLRALTGKKSDKETTLLTMRDQLDDLIKDGEYFVKVIGTYKINVRACGNWITSVIDQRSRLTGSIKRFAALLVAAAVMALSAGECVYADELPYDTYTYTYWEDIAITPAAYVPNGSVSGLSVGTTDFAEPQDLCVAPDGLVYVADTKNNRIVVLSADMTELVRIIDGFDRDGSEDTFNAPYGVCVSENNQLYVADSTISALS